LERQTPSAQDGVLLCPHEFLVVLTGTALDRGKMNIQLIANEKNQYRAQRGKDKPGGVKSFVSGGRKYVGNAAAENRSNDAERDRPEERNVHMHYRFRDDACKQSDNQIPK
jgi:hypothetical protein